jgi:hypothetical protein
MTNPSGAARRCLRGSSLLAGFDRLVRHHGVRGLIDFPLSDSYRSESVLWNSSKRTVVASNLPTGVTASNRRPTVPRQRPVEAFPIAG